MPVRPCAGCFTRLISLSHWIITYLINQNYFLPHFTDKNIEVERWQVTYLISYSQWILRWEGSPDNKAAEPEVRRAVSHSPGWLTLTQRQKGRAGVHSTHAEGQEEKALRPDGGRWTKLGTASHKARELNRSTESTGNRGLTREEQPGPPLWEPPGLR